MGKRSNWNWIGAGLGVLTFVLDQAVIDFPAYTLWAAGAAAGLAILYGSGAFAALRRSLRVTITIGSGGAAGPQALRPAVGPLAQRCLDAAHDLTQVLELRRPRTFLTRHAKEDEERILDLYRAVHREDVLEALSAAERLGLSSPSIRIIAERPRRLHELEAVRDQLESIGINIGQA